MEKNFVQAKMRLAGASLGTFLVYVAEPKRPPWTLGVFAGLIEGMKYNPVLRNLFFISHEIRNAVISQSGFHGLVS